MTLARAPYPPQHDTENDKASDRLQFPPRTGGHAGRIVSPRMVLDVALHVQVHWRNDNAGVLRECPRSNDRSDDRRRRWGKLWYFDRRYLTSQCCVNGND